jgi:Gas vesicle synthesis protein GvpL/GvpF
VNRFYVFALAGEACDPFEYTGHAIESIDLQGVYALVERSDRPPVVSEQALRDQHQVIAHLHARSDALLPARFGACLDARELESIVEQRRKVIVEALRLVRGRSQMTIRLLVAELTGPVRAAAGGKETATGTEYLESRRASMSALPAELSAASEAVRGITVGERFESGRARAAAMLYHLVDRGQIAAYRDQLAGVGSDDGRLTVTGPWAPFAFTPDLWT